MNAVKKIYLLSTCRTCQRILFDVKPGQDFTIQDIKYEKISADQLDHLKNLVGSYDALFTRRSRKYREWKLDGKDLTEKDKRALILKEYTFLKRPVWVVGNRAFVGSAKATVDSINKTLKDKTTT